MTAPSLRQVFPYSDHSSFPELCELVRRVRPREVLPLVKRWTARGGSRCVQRDFSSRADMSVFRTYLLVDSPARHPALLANSAAQRPVVTRTGSESGVEAERVGAGPAEDSSAGEGKGLGRARSEPPDVAAEQQQCPGVEAGDRPCLFLLVSGRLERLKQVLYTRQQVAQWLTPGGGAAVSD